MSESFPSITVQGRYFWRENARFFIRGVVYQLPNKIGDPITDDDLPRIARDIALFRELGINTLYVYRINNKKPHGQVMKLLEAAGIYVLASLSSPTHCISRLTPYECYNSTLLCWFFETIDLLAGYPNTLGIIAADQTINDDKFLNAAPVIKAVVGDLKRYMKLKNEMNQQRILPVAYDAMSYSSRDMTVLDYLTTGDVSNCVDFWSCKRYSWKEDPATLPTQIDEFLSRLGDTALPIFFSEYSDGAFEPRKWEELTILFSPSVEQILSGVCVYQFYELANGYGLVRMVEHDNYHRRDQALTQAADPSKVIERRETGCGSVLIFHDFANFKAKLQPIRKLENDKVQDAAITVMSPVAKPMHKMWPWEPEHREPGSCVDWHTVEEGIRNKR